MDLHPLIVVGGGGHFHACCDVIESTRRFVIKGIVDVKERVGQRVCGYEIIGTDTLLKELIPTYKNVFIAIGQIGAGQNRQRAIGQCSELGAIFPAIISPHAYVAASATVGAGTIVMHHALVNANAKIGSHCILNSKSLCEHDTVIGDQCHIATGAVVNGHSRVGSGSFVGSHSVVRENITVGAHSVIGFGSRVVRSVADNSKIVQKVPS